MVIKNRLGLALATLIVAATAITQAQAASITWSAGPTFNGPSGHLGILTNGSLVQAIDLTGVNGTPLTVDPSGINVTFERVNSPSFNNNFGGAGTAGNTDPAWASIISNFEWQSGSDIDVANFLSGLTVGRQYQLQLFASRNDGCCGRTHFFFDGVGNSSPVVADNSYLSIVGSFIADATTQRVGLDDSTNNPYLNAFVLRDITPVPVPAALPLMMSGLLAVVAARRRKQLP